MQKFTKTHTLVFLPIIFQVKPIKAKLWGKEIKVNTRLHFLELFSRTFLLPHFHSPSFLVDCPWKHRSDFPSCNLHLLPCPASSTNIPKSLQLLKNKKALKKAVEHIFSFIDISFAKCFLFCVFWSVAVTFPRVWVKCLLSAGLGGLLFLNLMVCAVYSTTSVLELVHTDSQELTVKS